MIKLECPESCSYLKSGRTAALEKVFLERVRFVESKGIPYNDGIPGFVDIMTAIEGSIVAVLRDRFKGLTDQDVVDGIDNAIRTAETQKSGIIYSHQAETAAAQAVSNAIVEILDLVREKISPSDAPNSNQMMTILNFIRHAIAFHKDKNLDGRDYLRFTTQFFPYSEKEKSLIITP